MGAACAPFPTVHGGQCACGQPRRSQCPSAVLHGPSPWPLPATPAQQNPRGRQCLGAMSQGNRWLQESSLSGRGNSLSPPPGSLDLSGPLRRGGRWRLVIEQTFPPQVTVPQGTQGDVWGRLWVSHWGNSWHQVGEAKDAAQTPQCLGRPPESEGLGVEGRGEGPRVWALGALGRRGPSLVSQLLSIGSLGPGLPSAPGFSCSERGAVPGALEQAGKPMAGPGSGGCWSPRETPAWRGAWRGGGLEGGTWSREGRLVAWGSPCLVTGGVGTGRPAAGRAGRMRSAGARGAAGSPVEGAHGSRRWASSPGSPGHVCDMGG